MITVEGNKLKVVENLGYNHSVGQYAKVVLYKGKERIVVRDAGCKLWTFYGIKIKPQGPITGQKNSA